MSHLEAEVFSSAHMYWVYTAGILYFNEGDTVQLSSVQFSRSVMSDSLQPHELQHAGPPCPSPTPGVHSDLRPLSQWCHPAISSSVIPFSSLGQSKNSMESNHCEYINCIHGHTSDLYQLPQFPTWVNSHIQCHNFLSNFRYPRPLPLPHPANLASLMAWSVKNPPEMQEIDLSTVGLGSIPGSGRSPGEGNGYPLQYSCPGNPIDRGVWWATVHGVTRVGHNLDTKPPPPTHPLLHHNPQAATLWHPVSQPTPALFTGP